MTKLPESKKTIKTIDGSPKQKKFGLINIEYFSSLTKKTTEKTNIYETTKNDFEKHSSFNENNQTQHHNDNEEYVIWTDHASVLDFLVNPVHWFLTLITLGLYFFVMGLIRSNTVYTLTNQRIQIKQGVFSKSIEEIELFRIKEISMFQDFFDLLSGLGTIKISEKDKPAKMIFTKLYKCEERRESIRKAVNESRAKVGGTVIFE